MSRQQARTVERPDDYDLPVTQQGRVRFTTRLRERYLTPHEANSECLTQAIGHGVFLWVWSERENLRVFFPIEGWQATRPYQQSIHRWSVSINRYLAEGSDTGIPVADHTSDGRRLVAARVTTTTDAKPEVLADVE